MINPRKKKKKKKREPEPCAFDHFATSPSMMRVGLEPTNPRDTESHPAAGYPTIRVDNPQTYKNTLYMDVHGIKIDEQMGTTTKDSSVSRRWKRPREGSLADCKHIASVGFSREFSPHTLRSVLGHGIIIAETYHPWATLPRRHVDTRVTSRRMTYSRAQPPARRTRGIRKERLHIREGESPCSASIEI